MRNKPKIETGHGPIYARTAAGTEENSLLSPTELYRHLKQVRAGRNGRALKVIEAQLPRSSLKPISSAVEAYRTRMRAAFGKRQRCARRRSGAAHRSFCEMIDQRIGKPTCQRGERPCRNWRRLDHFPLPKRASEYQIPEGTSLDEAQALLSRKFEEARVISRELEKRTGLRLTLSRNFQIVVDLSGR